MFTANQRLSISELNKETFIERHSWKVLLIISSIIGLFGLGDIIQGMKADPAIAESITGIDWEELQVSSPEMANLIDLQVRAGGAQLLIMSILSSVVCLAGFRHGQKWAWYALWVFPIWTAMVFLLFFTATRQPDMPPPPPMLSAPIFFIIAVLTLLLSYRKFSEAREA